MLLYTYIRASTLRAVSQKFGIDKTAGLNSIVFRYIYFSEVKYLEQ